MTSDQEQALKDGAEAFKLYKALEKRVSALEPNPQITAEFAPAPKEETPVEPPVAVDTTPAPSN